MACRLFGAKPISKQMLGYCQLDNKLKWNFNQKKFIHENVSENIVCELAAILPRGDELTGRQCLQEAIKLHNLLSSSSS